MEFDIENIKNIPSVAGLYYFYEGEKLLYIGKANNLKRRVIQHKHNHYWATIHNSSLLIDVVFNRITKIKIILIDKSLISAMEQLEIKKMTPILNHETYGKDLIFDEIKEYNKIMLKKVLDTI